MPAFMNTLGGVSRRGQWRFRHVFRSANERGQLDVTDAGLIDFSTASDVVLTVVPRAPVRPQPWCFGLDDCNGHRPVLTASLAAGTLVAVSGIIEALFPVGSLLTFPAGIYDVRVSVTVGPETEEIFNEPIEFA